MLFELGLALCALPILKLLAQLLLNCTPLGLITISYQKHVICFCYYHKHSKYLGRKLNLRDILSHHFFHGLCLSHNIALALALTVH